MSRTKRAVGFWVKDHLIKYPERCNIRSEWQHGYDDHSKSYLCEWRRGNGCKESMTGIRCRRRYKKLARRTRRRQKIEIDYDCL